MYVHTYVCNEVFDTFTDKLHMVCKVVFDFSAYIYVMMCNDKRVNNEVVGNLGQTCPF
jgi:hypothetical protein